MPTIAFKQKRKREAITKRYSSVAFELPDWAKEALSSKMGDVVVSAQESFEIFINNKEGSTPKDEYRVFCKKFTEIFHNRAAATLKKIIHNRNKEEEFYISNDYFWQEFSCLFNINTPLKNKTFRALKQIEKKIYICYKKTYKSIKNFFSGIARSIWITVLRTKLSKRMVKALRGKDLYGA